MTYGGVKLGIDEPFAGISTETVVYGGKLCTIKRVTCQGKIYTCDSRGNKVNVLSQVNAFQAAVGTDYQTFSAGGFSVANARCESLSITNSDYLGAEYSAEFLAYPDEWFKDTIGILDPVDSIKGVENKDGTISVIRNISARGVSKTLPGDGLNNVIKWIKGLNPKKFPSTHFLTSSFAASVDSLSPRRVQEVFNRAEGSVSVEVEFVFNSGGKSSCLLVFTVDNNYDDRSGIESSTVSGSISGGVDATIESVRAEFKSFNPFIYVQAESKKTFLPECTAKSIEEDEAGLTINFSFTYNTFPIKEKINSESTIQYDFVRDIATITIGGDASFIKTPQKYSQNEIDNLIKSSEIKTAAENEFTSLSPKKTPPLNTSLPSNFSISISKNSQVSKTFNVSYDNSAIIPDTLKDKILDFDYSIDYSPSINIKIPAALLKGDNVIFNLKSKTRARISIKGTAISRKSGLETPILDAAEKIIDDIGGKEKFEEIFLEKKSAIYSADDDDGYKYNFEVTKTAEGKIYGS